MTTVGILGSGDVGKTLALGFKRHGHTVTIGSREGTKLADWSAEHGIPEAPFAGAVAGTEVHAGDRFGVMKFGSRMDVFVPPSAVVEARVGDRVRAAETVLARFAEPTP